MGANRELQRYLQNLGFKLLVVLQIFITSREREVIAEYSLLNKLDKEIELFLYMSNDPFEGEVNESYIIPKEDYVKFVSLKTNDRSGFGEKYFIERIDSAKLKIEGYESFVAIWRSMDDFEYAEGFESLPDFFAYNNWGGRNKIQHGGSHAEYRFTLKLQEKR
ncbi:hypothetical protein [Perlabentimonas gracilis]|uniref:hypothetical protein n=1 Tax=Perlabentimonas gracilis TaxID=2715279 RepID=UPI00140B7077|nr:hypothetical protein [Perlabentimonas gracilis]NHB69545.1 hypothetical protein [Perlabentimonas gracilis]